MSAGTFTIMLMLGHALAREPQPQRSAGRVDQRVAAVGTIGGRRSGGTKLTPLGEQLIRV